MADRGTGNTQATNSAVILKITRTLAFPTAEITIRLFVAFMEVPIVTIFLIFFLILMLTYITLILTTFLAQTKAF